MLDNTFQKQIKISPLTKICFRSLDFIIAGPLGSTALTISPNIQVKLENSILFLQSTQKSLLLTTYSLFLKKIQGTKLGFFEILVVKGIGWRVFIENNNLVFKIGYSHLVYYAIPPTLEILIPNKQTIRIFGLDLNFVQQFASNLCRLRRLGVYVEGGVYRSTKNIQLKVSSKSK